MDDQEEDDSEEEDSGEDSDEDCAVAEEGKDSRD